MEISSLNVFIVDVSLNTISYVFITTTSVREGTRRKIISQSFGEISQMFLIYVRSSVHYFRHTSPEICNVRLLLSLLFTAKLIVTDNEFCFANDLNTFFLPDFNH